MTNFRSNFRSNFSARSEISALISEAYDATGNGTFTRASDKYNPYDGTTVGNNVPASRPYVIGGKQFNMDLMSIDSTNLALWSEDFENVAWIVTKGTVSNVGGGEGEYVTPDGTGGACYQTFSAIAGNDYTFSCFIKTTSLTNATRLVIQGNGGASGLSFLAVSDFLYIGDGWVQLKATLLNAPFTESLRAVFFVGSEPGVQTLNFIRPQIEELPIMTPYIKTEGVAVTRARETNIISSFPYTGSNATLFAVAIPYEHDNVDTGVRGDLWRGSTSNDSLFMSGDTIEGRRRDNLAITIKAKDDSAGLLSNIVYSFAHTWNSVSGDLSLTTQNGKITLNTINTPYESLLGSQFNIGTRGDGSVSANSWVHLLYFDRVLTDDEISLLRNGVTLL